MKYIQKQSPPEVFTRYTCRKKASYQDLTDNNKVIKQRLRESLLIEQGYICCYCGQEISTDNSVIEHLKNKNYHPNLQLKYDNLVCSCKGGQDARAKNPQYPLCCDAIKGNLDIYVYPVDNICENEFEFDDEGNIFGINEASRATIKILNLNNERLRHQRKSAIDTYRYLSDNDIDWHCELNLIMERNYDNKFSPFCFVLYSYIKNYRFL